MQIKDIKTPEDILTFMIENIKYGWLDYNEQEHIGEMKNVRKLYRTSSIEKVLNYKIGTCIEQVYLIHYLLERLNIQNKMYCTRIYESNDFDDLEAEEHMHCFILYYKNGKVYHLEHPNHLKVGIYEYENEEQALKEINDYFVELSGGIARPVTQFYKVDANLSFKEFNNYINSLNQIKIK